MGFFVVVVVMVIMVLAGLRGYHRSMRVFVFYRSIMAQFVRGDRAGHGFRPSMC